MHSPTQCHSGVLVVFEGHRRVSWSSPYGGIATPTALWPDPAQRQGVHSLLARQEPVLVIIDYDLGPLALLPEEVPTVPAELQHLIDEDDGWPALRVPLLEWLPTPLRGRGSSFLASVQAQRSEVPAALLPELVTDTAVDQPVRFACRTSHRPMSASRIGAAIRHLFTQHLGPAGGGSPGRSSLYGLTSAGEAT